MLRLAQARFGGGAVLALTVLAASAGCSKAEDSLAIPSPRGEQHFSGPSASDFQTAYEDSTSAKERRILEYGLITNQRGGFDVEASDGKERFDYQNTMDRVLQACERNNDGDVTYLYRQVITNPQRLDDSATVHTCLIREDLVPKAYGVAEFRRDNDAGTLPFDQFDRRGMASMDDPLGLWPRRR